MIRKKRMGKGIAKILSGLLVFGMVAGLVPEVPGGTVNAKATEINGQNVTTEPHTHCVCGTGNLSVERHTHKEETWTGISKLSDINREGNYYLTQDVTLTSAWTCQRNVNLCLNGHSITRTAKEYYDQNGNNAVIIIRKNVDFTITDCKGTGTITHKQGVSGEGVYNEGRFFMYNGTISGNNGGVKNPGMFFMYGGTITSNTADNGGGVDNDKGVFSMYGGTITSNTANNGGGVYNNNPGIFTMYGGTITNNNAGSGGGVYVSVNSSFDMYGGTITGNNTNSGGGGVYNNAGRFTMSGGKINNNTSNKGGGVYYISTVPFKMSGTAAIIDNKGGGVFVGQYHKITLSGAVKIIGNTVEDRTNNLYLRTEAIVTVESLKEGANIGVTTEDKPTEKSSVIIADNAASASYFSSDNSDYVTDIDENKKLVLKKKPAVEALTITTQPQPVSVKVGEEATFIVEAAGSGLKYQWQVNKDDNAGFVNIDGATNESYKFNVASAEFNGYQYQCVVSNQSGSVTSNPVTLTVTEDTTPVTYIITPTAGINGSIFPSNPVTVQDGGNQTFKITPDSGYEIASLIVDGAEVENLSNTYTFTDVRSTHTIEVSFKKQDDTPSTVEAPKIITQTQSVSVKAGEEATFTVNATGTDLKYQWQVNKNDNVGFVNIDGATSESYKFNVASAEFNGYQYQCVVSNQSGSVTSASIILTVTENSTPTPEPKPEPTPNPKPTPTPAPNPTPEAAKPSTPSPAPEAAPSTSTPSSAATPAQVTYDILDGAGSSWTQNTDGSLAIRGSGEISKFREVKVDGVTVDPVNYTVTEGSTIITFKPEYLKSLSAGNHSFELVWTDGTAATNFTVAENADQSAKSPKTGEDFSMALCTVLLMVSCAGLAGMFVRRKKSSLR